MPHSSSGQWSWEKIPVVTVTYQLGVARVVKPGSGGHYLHQKVEQ
jgi:hypothetical protein